MRGASLVSIVSYLDEELALAEFPDDDSINGLQVEGRPVVRRVGVAVDACAAVFEQAWQQGIDLLVVHHGLIWGGIRTVKGTMKKRLQILFDAGISLYACHLPLDWHPVLGNNIRLLKTLGLRRSGPFGEYHGKRIGYWGKTGRPVRTDEFIARVERKLATTVRASLFTDRVRNVGIVSGGGWSAIHDAERFGIDTLLTGEPSHSAYTLAEELRVNLVFAGHYATETLGVAAAGELLGGKFGLPVQFIHHPTGL